MSAFRAHPIDAVAAILPDEQHVNEAVEALRAEGVDVSQIEKRHGAEGIRDLDRAGTEHGWKARLIRLWQNWTYYEQILLLYTDDMLFIPREKLAKAPGGGWVLDFNPGFVKALGAVEILGVVGLILPALLAIAPVLVPLAALGLGLIMIGAAIVEFRRQEFKHLLLDLVYPALAVFVAFGRFGPESFTS